MNYKVIWSSHAEKDLNDIVDYIIQKGDINNAYAVYLKIKERAELLEVSPEQGRGVPEFRALGAKYREIIIKPWRMIYKIDKELIKIIMLIDGRMDSEELLFERLVRL